MSFLRLKRKGASRQEHCDIHNLFDGKPQASVQLKHRRLRLAVKRGCP